MGIRHRIEQDMDIATTAQAYAKAVALENFFKTKMAMCAPPVESYSLPNQDYVPTKFRLASVAAVPSASMQVQAVQDVLVVQEQMPGYAGQDAREAARKVRAQEELQRQDREIQEEAMHLQEQQAKHEEVMRKMREKSAQAAEQRRAEHAEERVQEELRAAQWEASSILSEARRKEEKADRRLVEVYAIGEAQGPSVAYVPEDGDRFGGVRGAGGSYRGYQGRQEPRGGYYEQQWGGYQGGSKGGSKGGKGYQGGKGKGKMVRTGQVPGSKDFSGCSSCWSGAGLTCKDHSRVECSLYWETIVAGKSWKEGELWPGGRHHVARAG